MADQVFPAAPLSFGASRVVATPFQFALTEDDNLQIVSANSLVGVALAVQGRKLSAAGKIEPFAFSHTPNTNRSTKTENFKLGAGALLNLTIFASNGAPVIGQTFVSVRMIRGLSAATILLGGLLGGYVTSAQPLTYPGSPIQSSIEGGGYIRTIVGTDPAPGVEIAETVPTGARWQLLYALAPFAASAAVANRRPTLVLRSPGGVAMGRFPMPATLAAGAVALPTWGSGLQRSAEVDTTYPNCAIPAEAILLAGGNIETFTENLQAADDYTPLNYTVREWLEVS